MLLVALSADVAAEPGRITRHSENARMPAGTGSGPEGAGFLLGKHRSGKEESARKACYRLHPAPGIPDPKCI
jgi:hypothetical protein